MFTSYIIDIPSKKNNFLVRWYGRTGGDGWEGDMSANVSEKCLNGNGRHCHLLL